ncbi:MAG: 3-hydroxyisobutyrate dehydrogenase [Chloroflexota bacterium]
MTQSIGFVGVGTMGSLMARNLLKAHHEVTVFDVNSAAAEDLREFGAAVAASAAEAAGAGDVVITMLPSSPHVEEAVLGPSGVLAGMRPGTVLIDMSTIDPMVSRRVAERVSAAGFRMLDAPVSGGSVGARDATLTIMVGGPADLLEQCRPVLEALGSNVIHCGDSGMGEVVKVVNNLIAGVSMAVVAEGINIGIQAGADPRILFDVISKSSGGSWALQKVFPVAGVLPDAPVERDFEPGFMVDLMRKDLGLAMSAAKTLGVPTILAAVAHEMYGAASHMGYGRKDMSAVVKAVQAATKH